MTFDRNRPNANLILDTMRDGDTHDMWGTAMGWAFACAENLHYRSQKVPDECGFRPSPLGACLESYEDLEVWGMLERGEATIADVQFAAKCLARYTAWLDAAGLAY